MVANLIDFISIFGLDFASRNRFEELLKYFVFVKNGRHFFAKISQNSVLLAFCSNGEYFF